MVEIDAVEAQESQEANVPPRRETTKYPWIDVLRGVAILGVIAVHAYEHTDGLRGPIGLFLSFGQMGVQLFFVASAITLCMSISNRAERHPVLSFYVRRYFRIAPLYYLGIILYALVSIPNNYMHGHGLDTDSAYNLPNIAANVLFIHGFYPPGNNNVVPGGWSIATEMSFYAVFPLLFAIFVHIEKKREAVGGLIIALCGAVELTMGSLTGLWPTNLSFEYLSLLNQLPVFVIGMMAYYRLEKAPEKILPAAIVGTLSLLAAIALWKWQSHARMTFFFIPMLFACAFSASALVLGRISIRYPDILVSIGKNSYSIYILHVALLFLTDWGLILLHAHLPSVVEFLLRFLFILGFAYVGARITEQQIERRGIGLGSKIVVAVQAGLRNDKAA